MAKARSPSYPVIGLRDAIERVTAVYREDYQNPISRAVAVSHMGYSGLSGASLGVLSALGKYGLLEGRGENTRVSDLAVQIIAHPPGTPERAQAIKQAAGSPELFAELDSRFTGKFSDQAIKSYLLTEKFIPSAAELALRSYRETRQLVEEEFSSFDSEKLQKSRALMVSIGNPTVQTSSPTTNLSGTSTSNSPSYEIANVRVTKDCAIRLIADGPYDKRSIEILVKNLQLQLELGTYDEPEQPSS